MNNCKIVLVGKFIDNDFIETNIDIKGNVDIAMNMLLDSVISMSYDYDFDLSLIMEYLINNSKGLKRYGSKNS